MQSQLLTSLKKKALENTVGKREHTYWFPAFSHFPTEFSAVSKSEITILATFNFSSANAFNLVISKILLFGNRLN